MQVFKKLKDGLKNALSGSQGSTGSSALNQIANFFSRRRLDKESLETLEELLFQADFGLETSEQVMEAIKTAYKKDRLLSGNAAAQMGAIVLKNLLHGAEGHFTPSSSNGTEVLCLIGINGSGKTTTAAKLAFHYQQQGYSCLLGACDTFRAAANEQIALWAERLELELVSSQQGADPSAVAFDAHDAACSRKRNLAILDTAGRLHTQSHLVAELQKMMRVLKKRDAAAPQHIWLVVDGSLGSNSIDQAKLFHDALGLTGLVVTKLDGTSRGGALVGIYRSLKIPIYFVGIGEGAEDLQPFSVDDYVEAIFEQTKIKDSS